MLTRVAVRDNTGWTGRRRPLRAGALILSVCLLQACAAEAPEPAAAVDFDAPAPAGVPVFELDPSWPAPLADADAAVARSWIAMPRRSPWTRATTCG